jgi:hypothetical protein
MASRMGQRKNLLAQILVRRDIYALAMEQEAVDEAPWLSERCILQLLAQATSLCIGQGSGVNHVQKMERRI